MRSQFLIFAILLLSACNGPSPALRGSEGIEMEVEGSHFLDYRRGIQAEAIRTNFEFPATVRHIFPKAAIAIEHATGCPPHIASMTGDAAHIKADLNCPEPQKQDY